MTLRALFAHASLIAVLSSSLFAESFTLTDKQGRTLKTDVLSIEDDTARIKREDGQQFDLALSTLSEEDQKRLRAWDAIEDAKPKPVPANAIGIVTGKAKFDSKRVEKDEPYTAQITRSNGSTGTESRIRTLVTITEQWGYSVTVTNRSPATLTNLRAEYSLFTNISGKTWRSASNSFQIGTLKSREDFIAKTSMIPFVKSAYKGTNPKPVGGLLVGIWVRVYRGDELIYETASPDSLRTSNPW